GLSASTLASQTPVPGKGKNQLHCGSVVPPVGDSVNRASYSSSFFMTKSPPVAITVHPLGPTRPAGGLTRLTPYASAPGLREIAPGSATVVVRSGDAVPDA